MTEVGDRAEAILRGIDALQPGDALLIAGKGHETGRLSAIRSCPSTMSEQASIAVMPRWTGGWHDALDSIRGRSRQPAGAHGSDWTAGGVSIDTRTIQPGDLFVALKAARDGHDFVAQALEKGAGAALVSRIPEGRIARATRHC